MIERILIALAILVLGLTMVTIVLKLNFLSAVFIVGFMLIVLVSKLAYD
jgi:hypothetical protein